jgi:hypothetical protein
MDLLVTDRLERGLPQPGCVICRVGDEAARHYLSTVLHESVNVLATRQRLAVSWGFCPRHGWGFLVVEWARCHDGMSTANLTQWHVQRVLRLLRRPFPRPSRPVKGWRRRRDGRREPLRQALQPSGECPACESQRQDEAYVLAVLLDHLAQNSEVSRLFRDSLGLCLAHLRMALEIPDRDAGLEALLEAEAVGLETLDGELEAYLRKHEEIQARFRRSRGLCLGHFRELLSQAEDPATYGLLLEVETRAVCALAQDLETFRQTFNDRADEAPSDSDPHVWRRTIDLFACLAVRGEAG